MTDGHLPVMVDEVLHFLRPTPGMTILDATVGAGGHAEAILHATGGRVQYVGVDRDPVALERAGHRLEPFGAAVRLVRSAFADLDWVVSAAGLSQVDAVLLDLGMSSMQVDDAARGFAFRRPGPLDMRMDPTSPVSAADVVNTYAQADIERILRTYGEERFAKRVASAICAARRRAPIRTTDELAKLVIDAYPPPARRGTHPARRTFQALRIEVNDELGQLERALRSAPGVLADRGRIVVLSYHSLEDKLVKRVFADLAEPPPALPGLPAPADVTPELKILTRGAILPSQAEIERNPRASSARLRAAERLPEEW